MELTDQRHIAISTTVGAAIALVIIVILGVGIYFATSSGTNSSTNSSGTGTNSTATTSTNSSGGAPSITIPTGAGGPSQLNFSPASMTVAAGTTVTFTNQDTAVHNVHFVSGPSGATLPSTSPDLHQGSTFTVTLTTPGTYNYICDYHTWMKGTITVIS